MAKEFVLEKPCNHIAFIMDGNGRWAKKRLLPRYMGHKAGCDRLIEIQRACQDLGIKVVTYYAFSTENWKRPQDEIDHIFNYLDEFFEKNIDEFMERGTKVHIMGDVSRLPEHSQITIKDAIERTKNNTNCVFNVCLNYGGRQDIVHACKGIIEDIKNGKLKKEDLNEETFKPYLYSEDLPDIDLMIRTSGEVRISNYCLYQLSYAEMIFTETAWPDFNKERLIECLKEYQDRDRRFGALK